MLLTLRKLLGNLLFLIASVVYPKRTLLDELEQKIHDDTHSLIQKILATQLEEGSLDVLIAITEAARERGYTIDEVPEEVFQRSEVESERVRAKYFKFVDTDIHTMVQESSWKAALLEPEAYKAFQLAIDNACTEAEVVLNEHYQNEIHRLLVDRTVSMIEATQAAHQAAADYGVVVMKPINE